MKPTHFRENKNPKPSCSNCDSLWVKNGVNIYTGTPMAGIGEYFCKRHNFTIVKMSYMPSYEANNLVCDDWKRQ